MPLIKREDAVKNVNVLCVAACLVYRYSTTAKIYKTFVWKSQNKIARFEVCNLASENFVAQTFNF